MKQRVGLQSVAIEGLWLRGSLEGGCVEVLVEIDGAWRLVGSEPIADDLVLASHIFEPAGIVAAPLDAVTR